MSVVSVQNIKRSYGDVEALKGVSFEVDKGEIFGIIGPDGAGKTTLFRILTTLLLADEGSAIVDGDDVVKDYKNIRKKVGYMPGTFSLYQDLSVEENLKVFATLFGTTIEENYHLIEDIYSQIEPFKSRKAGALSGGMKQKLALSCALIHEPVVLFLDEPTTGVDPVSRKELWAMLKKLKKEGITILVSTPYMDEASLCDRIALVQDGNFMRIDTPDAITASFDHQLYSVAGKNMSGLLKTLRANPKIRSSYAFGDTHHVTTEGMDAEAIQSYLEENGGEDIMVKEIPAGIEDCFMDLTAVE